MSHSEVERAGLARPEDLTARINAEHRACKKAMNDALGHALAAGDLLAQAKATRSHGTWQAWIAENFEGSIRTAQVYMDLASRRAEIEAANAQSAAHLSIARALQITRPTVGPVLGAEPGAELPPEIERGLEEEREFWLAWKRPQEEGLASMREAEQEERIREAGRKLVPVANGLHELAHPGSGYKPEEVGEALARVGDARTIAALRNCASWLLRVAEEAEAERARVGRGS